jgi:ABC-2 type transport system permease protein
MASGNHDLATLGILPAPTQKVDIVRAFSIARKTLLEYLREPLLIGLLFAFPVMMLAFYYLAFGETEQGMAKFLKVLVINHDEGTLLAGESWQAGSELVDLLRSAEFEGSPIFDISPIIDQSLADIALREYKASLLLVIPHEFSNTLARVMGGETHNEPAAITLKGYPSSDNYVFARSLLESYLHHYVSAILGWQDGEAQIDYEFVPGTGTMSDFDFGVPGVIVFGVMFVAISTAMTMVRENVSGTLRRLRLTKVHARDLLLGVTGAQMVLAGIMVPVTFGTAVLMGFHNNGSILLAIGIGLLFGLSQVGIGLLTACFARNDGEAANLSATIGVMLVFVSGAIYPLPEAPLVDIAGRTIQLYDLMPPYHAATALQRVLTFGDGPAEIAYELGCLALLSAITYTLGIFLYQRLRLRKET